MPPIDEDALLILHEEAVRCERVYEEVIAALPRERPTISQRLVRA